MGNKIKTSKIVILKQKKELDDIVSKIIAAGSSLRIKFERKQTEYKYSNSFIIDCIIRVIDLVTAMSKLQPSDLDSIFILKRSELEVDVDLHWFYSVYLNNMDNAENLAKRFYQFGADHYLSISENFENVVKSDLYLKEIKSKLDPIKEKTNANKKIIEIVDSHSSGRLKKLQKQNWRALPGLINSREEIEFKARAEIASKIAEKISNLKFAPYYQNWNILNAFTHWSPARMKYLDAEVAEAYYYRHLNISLGFLQDMFNIGYHYLKVKVPFDVQLIRQKFQYTST